VIHLTIKNLMKKIIDDIYLCILPLPFPFSTSAVSIYYLDGEEPALIDTGVGDVAAMHRISSELSERKRRLSDISIIINTHEHVEHFGGNKKIQESSQASSIASSRAARVIEGYHQYISDIRERFSEFQPEKNDLMEKVFDFHLMIDDSKIERSVDDGDMIDLGSVKLRVIATPGHACGHICLYDEERKILFTGDHVIATGTTFVGYGWRELATRRIEEIFDTDDDKPDNVSLYLASLERLQSLELELMLPGHGLPIREPYKKLRDDRKKKMNRERVILEILEKRGEIALDALIEEVYEGNRIPHLVRGATLGYLERLSKTGKVAARVRENTLYLRFQGS
jgi:glyoxylase-like metal-dependent hydrolase (beta-lactamase superfamily II)